MKFEVSILYRGQDTYIVEADNIEEAEAKAREMFYDCAPASLGPSDFEKIEKIREIKEI